jgi:hydroxyethylthiazole kinase-like uncharacterized protein yjeF
MPPRPDQILTVAQMRAAEDALIEAGTSVEALMDLAGRGAAEWVWRIAAHRPVTVLCGPGNNGGDGYVIAEALRERGGQVVVIAPVEPKTAAARNARALYRSSVLGGDASVSGEVLVDCLFGSGLVRPLSDEHLALLQGLAGRHRQRIAIDLPSGVESDTGQALNGGLPQYDLTVALGAWKFAHHLMPACAAMGTVRLVGIGVAGVKGAAQSVGPPKLDAPAADAHKYRRGLLGVVAGRMPGASVLAATAAQHAGAGYVKLLGGGISGPSTGSGRADVVAGVAMATNSHNTTTTIGDDDNRTNTTTPAQPEPVEGHALPPDLVFEATPLALALRDKRWSALLVGPGLGRGATAREGMLVALSAGIPVVADADALMLLQPADPAPIIATPHEGELAVLEQAFGLPATGSKPRRALALAQATGTIIVAKGPDTVIAAPDGRVALAERGSSWLSTAGTGDVLAGIIASRLATGVPAFEAACQGVWLHAEAARHCRPPFTAGDLARALPAAYGAGL